MRFLSLLALLLSACTAPSAYGPAFRQAAARPAPYQTPPVHTPGYFPGTPAEPVYTPQGAGLPGERVPATRAAPVQHSPNKRVLPATGEAGVWAADGDPALSAGVGGTSPLFGASVPYPSSQHHVEQVMEKCVAGLREVAEKTGHEDAIAQLPLPVRKCLAARAIAFCAETAWNDFVWPQLNYASNVAGEVGRAAKEAVGKTKDAASRACDDVVNDDARREALESNATRLDDIVAHWKRAEQARQPNRFTR